MILLLFILWAFMDLLKNWENYQVCPRPIGEWIVISMAIIIVMRTYQIVAFTYSYDEIKETLSTRIPFNGQTHLNEISIITLNWSMMPTLKKYTYMQFVLYAFMIYWTVLGTIYFIESDEYYAGKINGRPMANSIHPSIHPL